jgi:BlaI family transcriptional regulator, penicillinase repressor
MTKAPKHFKPTRLELEVLDALWKLGSGAIREIQESLPAARRPEYTTVQTIVYRLEEKGAVRRARKIGNAHIFEPCVTRQSTLARLIDDFIGTLGGSHEPLVAHLVETGKISTADLKEIEKLVKARRAGDAGPAGRS